MIIFEKTCFEVVECYDRDRNHVAYASTTELAEILCKDKKGMRDPYKSWHEVKLRTVIIETENDIFENKRLQLIQSAKSKLTKDELNAMEDYIVECVRNETKVLK